MSERSAFILNAGCGGHPVRLQPPHFPNGRQNVGANQSIGYRRPSPLLRAPFAAFAVQISSHKHRRSQSDATSLFPFKNHLHSRLGLFHPKSKIQNPKSKIQNLFPLLPLSAFQLFSFLLFSFDPRERSPAPCGTDDPVTHRGAALLDPSFDGQIKQRSHPRRA